MLIFSSTHKNPARLAVLRADNFSRHDVECKSHLVRRATFSLREDDDDAELSI